MIRYRVSKRRQAIAASVRAWIENSATEPEAPTVRQEWPRVPDPSDL